MTHQPDIHSASNAGRIPCLILTHGRDSVNRLSLEAVLHCDARFDIDVVHNPSVLEDGTFTSYARELVANGRISSFTQFDENISNNAVLVFLLENLERYSAEFVVLSDGDVVPPPGLVAEQIDILRAHSEVMACGVRIDATSWSDTLSVKADLVRRFNTSMFETEDFVDSATGLWMTMFRGCELRLLIETMVANAIRFTDGNLKRMGGILLDKKWVATKRSIGRELNREQPDYHDARATSTTVFGAYSPEPAGSRYATWNHDHVCQATTCRREEELRVTYPPLAPAAARFRDSIETDRVVVASQSGELTHALGYVTRHPSQARKPGLVFVLSRGRPSMGIPHLPGERSLLFIGPEDTPGSQLYGLDELDFDATLITWTAEEAKALLNLFARFIGSGGTVKGIVFHSATVREHISQGEHPARGHLPPPVRNEAIRLASRCAPVDDPALDEFIGTLCSDEVVSEFARRAGWEIRTSPPTPGRHFAYVQLTARDSTGAEAGLAAESGVASNDRHGPLKPAATLDRRAGA